MTELERRALLGDKEAQRECTEKGIILPCSHCSGPGKYGQVSEDWLGLGYKTTGFNVYCSKCIAGTQYNPTKEESLEEWNTRPAPPIGRCAECKNWDFGACYRIELTKRDDYCSYFEPKESEKNDYKITVD